MLNILTIILVILLLKFKTYIKYVIIGLKLNASCIARELKSPTLLSNYKTYALSILYLFSKG
jgi:hypothetical protein